MQAANDFNIDLSLSYMIGDSQHDVVAGRNAGCQDSILVATNQDMALLAVVNRLCR